MGPATARPVRTRRGPPAGEAALAARVVQAFGGRFSCELGIDVDRGPAQVERWFVAATLFGTRIAASVAERAFAELERAGVHRIADAGDLTWEALVAALDAGGYARYDFRTATRLQTLAGEVRALGPGGLRALARTTDPVAVRDALAGLSGWGPVTTSLFLRELRGVWPAARPPLDERAATAAVHLGLLGEEVRDPLRSIDTLAAAAACDPRDLEAALVRLGLAHRRVTDCPGGRHCVVLERRSTWGGGAGGGAPPRRS